MATGGNRIAQREMARLDSAYVTAGVAALYVIGFVVTNVHFGVHGLIQPAFLRARYLGAAVLMIAVTAPIVSLGVVGFLHSPTAVDPAPPRSRYWRRTTRLLVHLAAAVTVWTILMTLIAVRTPFFFRGVSFFVGAFGAGLGVASLMNAHRRRGPAFPFMNARNALGTVWLILLLSALFGTSAYEEVRPQFGGGAVWVADVRLYPDSLTRALGSGFESPVAILDRDDRYLTALTCASGESAQYSASRELIPLAALQSARLVSPMTVGEYIRASRRGGCAGLARALADVEAERLIKWSGPLYLPDEARERRR